MNDIDFKVGLQPCYNLDRIPADIPEREHAKNVHVCAYCNGFVTFCGNCARDHHLDGWDKCFHPQTLSEDS